MRNKELSLREDALDREATLMNVLKSVNQKSEPDLVEVTKETTSSTKTSGFNWFRSKSKEQRLGTSLRKFQSRVQRNVIKGINGF